jgi:hypothetical protein
MSEGMMYQRGPQGQVPDGQSIEGQDGAYGNIPLNGEPFQEHVTMHGQGWQRSWDNPGPTGDHSRDHATRNITQHPH